MGTKRRSQDRPILRITDFYFRRILYLRRGHKLDMGKQVVEERIQFRYFVWEFFLKFPMQFVNNIVADNRLIGWTECLQQCLRRSSTRKKNRRNKDVGIEHYSHSADSSLRDW